MLTYNREDCVARAVKSILDQTFIDFEFIIVNNGSTDASGQICETLAAADPRIKLTHRDQGTIGAGRNTGIEMARGDYIAFIDDDDYAYPDMLAFLIELAQEHRADIAFCGSHKNVDGELLPNCTYDTARRFTPEDAVIELCERKLLNAATPTKLFHKSLFLDLSFDETQTYDDISLVYKLFAFARTIVGHGLPKYAFVRHSSNNSAFTQNDALITPEQLDEYLQAYRERTEWLIKHLPGIKEYAHYSEWSFHLSMYHKIVSNDLKQCSAQQQHLKESLSRSARTFEHCAWIKPFEVEWLDKYGY
jgi:glycosyltransferase involved in cell wall biosynthesis